MEDKKYRRDELIYACWQRGFLKYKLRSYQKTVYDYIRKFEELGDAGPPIIYVNFSRQTGKTYLDGVILLEDCIRRPNTYVTFVSSTKADAKDIIKKVMIEIMDDCPPNIKPQWRNDDHAYVFSNGSELAVLGADDDDQVRRIRGRPRYKNVVDEARNIRNLKSLVDSVLIPSMVTTGGNVLLTTTPADTPAHESKHYYDMCKLDKSLFELTIWDAQKSCPNEFPQTRLDYLAKASGGYGSTSWMREYEARWVVEEERAIVPEWSVVVDKGPPVITHGNSITVKPYNNENKKYYQKYVCMDMGVVDATWVGFAYYDFREAMLVFEKEWWLNGPTITTEKIATAVKDIEKELGYENPIRIADNNNKMMLQDMAALYHLPFTPVTKTREGKGGSLQSHVNRLREWVKQRKIQVFDTCPFLIGCMENGIWNEQRNDFDKSVAYKHFDAISGVMYVLKYVDQQTNPLPSFTEYDYNKHVLPHEARRLYTEEQKRFGNRVRNINSIVARRRARLNLS